MIAGSIGYDTKLDISGFQNGLNKMMNSAKNGGSTIKSIVAGLGITKIISTAMNTINNSLDGAISRLDIMNNYPKVMKNLGFSVDDAKKSVDELSNGLDGLPTALDDAVISVQRLVSKNSDIDKSTKYFLSMNNAILAGGASVDIQKSALEQLTQAYSKGKPDLMEWRTLQMAMPGQLKQIAQAMGYLNDTELYEAFKNGTVSMDEFMDTIVKLNSEGVNGLANFQEQAKDATGGIATSITNLKTRIKKGLADVIAGINKSLAKSNTSISSIIDVISVKLKNALTKIGTIISKINIKKLANTLKILIPILTSVLSTMIAYQSAIKIVKTIDNIKNSFKSLTMVLSANPFILAVTGVTALISGMHALKSIADENITGLVKINDTLDNYDKSMQKANNARQTYLNENMSEIKGYENLYRELQLIVDENGKVKDGYEQRAKFIVGELNNALGTEIQLTDGQIQNYQQLKSEVASVIEQKRAQILLEAEEEKYNTAKDNRVKLEEAYANAIKESKKAENEKKQVLDEIQKYYGLSDQQLERFIGTGRIYTGETNKQVQLEWNLANKLANVNNEYNSANRTLEETKKAYLDNESVIGNYELAMQNLADGNYQAVLKMYEDTTNYQGKTKEDTYNNYQASIEAQKQYLQDLKNGKGKFEEESRQAAITATEAKILQLQDEQAKYKSAIELGQSEAKAVWNTGLANQLSEITGHTVEFQKTADGHIQAYIDGVKQGGPMSKKEAKKFASDITDEIKKQTSKGGKEGGENLGEGIKLGIGNKQGSVFSNVESFGKSILSKLKSSLKEHSPSKASEEMGEFLDEGLENGVLKGKKNVLKTIDMFGNDIVDKMQNAVVLETGNINAKASLNSNYMYNSVIQVNAKFDGDIELDHSKVGRAIAPEVTKTIKIGGLR